MRNNLLRLAGILGFLAVALGAFGAHALKSQLGPGSVETFNTGVRYHFYHTLALLCLAMLVKQDGPSRILGTIAWCFGLGILFFSGSLYLLSTSPITGLPASWLGPITPLGGFLFIVGWLLLTIRTFQSSNA